jgi:hypothetical protein
METPVTAESEEQPTRPTTAPDSFTISARAFDSEERAQQLGSLVGACIRELSRQFDLGRLDGVTVAYDYAQALLDLDRGYETSFRLTPSDTHVVGIAMTPSVIRDGTLKSHVLLNAAYMAPLEDFKHEHFGFVLHTISHECAHVEITHKFDAAFPGFLLRTAHADARIGYRWQIILACWDEYAATMLSAGFGTEPTEGYEDTFLKSLLETRQQANNHIKAYRIHANIDRILGEVYVAYGDLMKFTAYHLGNLRGLGRDLSEMPRTVEALKGHWFAPHFARLDEALKDIAKDYGKWTDKSSFEVVGDLADELLAHGGIHYKSRVDGRLYIDIPFTAETMPSEAEAAQFATR